MFIIILIITMLTIFIILENNSKKRKKLSIELKNIILEIEKNEEMILKNIYYKEKLMYLYKKQDEIIQKIIKEF
jgi:hypothetical protein